MNFNNIPDFFWKYKVFILLVLKFTLFISVSFLFQIMTPILEVFFAFYLICHLIFDTSKLAVSYLGASYVVSHIKRSILFITLLLFYAMIFNLSDEIMLRVFAAFMCIEILLSCAYLLASRVLLKRRIGVENQTPIIIWGAGSAGKSFSTNLRDMSNYRVVAFIDDDEDKIGSVYGDIKVYGRNDIQKLKSRWDDLKIYLALPSLQSNQILDIRSFLKQKNLNASVLPHYVSAQNDVTSKDFVSLEIDSLIGRPKKVKYQMNNTFDENDTVLITGGGGSIGLELAKSCITAKAQNLVILDHSEYNLYKAKEAFEANNDFDNINIFYELSDIRNNSHLYNLFNLYNFDYVYHAAAYKHVPIVEDNIIAGLENNVFGTENVASLSGKFKVKKFVLISTDKAVRPTSIMGATKRVAELVVGSLTHQYPETVYSMVRFGNVVGSSGSVIPMFQKQIVNGGPITVTHKEITRYFMSISEACDLVLFAGNLALGGEVFILDMGKPVKIYDIAKSLIIQSGNKVKSKSCNEGIEIIFTGLRPGEKLFEELLVDIDSSATEHPKIFKANESKISKSTLIKVLNNLKLAISKNDVSNIIAELKLVVEGFNFDEKLIDISNN